MNQELLELLEESLRVTKKLLSSLEADKQDMRRCITGEVLEEYCYASDEAADIVKNMQKNLIVLQSSQLPGL